MFQIQGIIPIGSSMDSESLRSREAGCWDGPTACSGLVNIAGDFTPANDFEPGEGYHAFLMDIGFGKTVDSKTKDFWATAIRENYQGDKGKRRICMAAVNLAGRDGLYERLPYVKCPVLWLQVCSSRFTCQSLCTGANLEGSQGTDDVVFSLKNAEEEIKLFTNSVDARVVPFQGGVHFLSYTHQQKVHEEIIRFISTWKEKGKAVL